ncbi:extracellular solute-binding protein [Paenibacillus sabinae]|uniref:Family 1 extracellular solute-binding protein n=1 Tax=Paenibacillus sabinae T27 TaxID=1268072 RepID=X4ZW99_9BACL|nr:extracellular solute-binding protein [Paenibacillus sabinae]AHV96004.1 family 1 extracellular solute-binding protein [Paenibacillus sabinae T27]
MNRKMSIVLSTLLCASVVMTACSGNNASNNAPAASKAPSASSPAGDASGDAAGFPLKDKLTIKAVAKRPALAPSDFNDFELAKRLESDTNVHVDWTTIVDTDYDQKKNLLLASGDLPDMFFGAGFTDTELLHYGQDGTIIPLNDLIDKHMPNLKALFDKRPDIKALVTAPDGNIYSLPVGEELGSGQEDIGANPDFLYINSDWLKNLGLEMPKTLEEYHNVLKAFKDKDPNKNGKKDEIPLSFINAYWTGDIGYLFGAFGEPDKTYQPGNNTFSEHLNVKDGKVYYAAMQPGYKEAVKYFHTWFEEGLVDIESFTHNDAQYLAKGKTEDESLGSFLWWDHTDVVGGERDDHYPIVPPFKDMVVKWNNGSAIGRGGTVITEANKNPEITAEWLDRLYDPVTAAEVHWGPIGTWFEKDANGLLVQKKDIENPGEFRRTVALGGAGVITGEDFEKVVAPEPRAKQRMDDIKNIFVPQMEKEHFPLIFFTDQELQTIDRLKPEIQTYTNKMRAQFLMDGGVDEGWDKYVSDLKKMGIEDLMKVYQDGYDRYLQAQK